MRANRLFAAVTAALLLGVTAAAAQNAQKPQQPPAVAPAKPYKPVTITLPQELNDPAFEAFRKDLGAAAQKKDRAALGKLTVAKGFFWDSDRGERADKSKPGIDNLVAALGLANKDGVGWDMLASYADDPTASQPSNRKGVVCGPADPTFDLGALDALLKATQTDVGEWGYPVSQNIEVHATPGAAGAVTGKLPLALVRVMPEPKPVTTAFVRIVTPDGKTGYVSSDSVAPIGSDQICYVKEGGAWKVGGYIGTGDPQ